jgi:hypothetical protein
MKTGSSPYQLINFSYESLTRDRRENQLAPQTLYRAGAGQASAGYAFP